jgi:hypothetical protein
MADTRFEVHVFSLPHSYGGHDFHGEQQVHDLLVSQNIPHTRIREADLAEASYLLRRIRPHYIFRQRPWTTDLPPELDGRSLTFARLCYIPYGYMVAGIEEQQFRQPFHRVCDYLFWPDEIHRELALADGVNDPARSFVTGYPKFDYICSSVEPEWPLPSFPRARTELKVLWAPHWTIQSRDQDPLPIRFGAIMHMHGAMVELAQAHPEWQIVMRPHPILMEQMRDGRVPDTLTLFLREWDRLPNTAVHAGLDYAGLFRASDVMVTDGLSFLTEYPLLDKPLIFYRRPDSSRLNAAGENIVKACEVVHETPALGPLLRDIARGRENPRTVHARAEVRGAIHRYPGQAADRIAEILARLDHP